MSVKFVLEALVVLGAIVMGTRAGGVGVGLWGGLGTFVLVFVFGEAPGEPPAAALAIILAVVTAASMMQAAGGIDWMVAVAARVIEKHPKQITAHRAADGVRCSRSAPGRATSSTRCCRSSTTSPTRTASGRRGR